MNKLVDKTIQVYKNQGVRGLAKKSKSTIKYRAGNAQRKLSFRKESLDEKSLREEYSFVSNSIFQITSKDIELSKLAGSGTSLKSIKTATWFVPYYSHFGFNGIQTIFRFIEKLSKEGVHNRIVIYDRPTFDTDKMRQEIARDFPDTKNYEIIVFGDDQLADIDKLPESDIAFCTIWVSAYLLLRYNKAKRKYYFIQDYEPLFYVAGSTSALAESTYRFGFTGVVNTPGLLAAVNQEHGQEGISFVPAVNRDLYYPDPNKNNAKVRIFFYARPLNPRNSFDLGILTIKKLLDTYGKRIEIITAGAEWNEAQYNLKGKITNLGLIKSLDDVAALYRTCDIGFAYMMNKHTTYQMMEYAASGMATVMNENEDHHWLHKDGYNCLLSEPSPAALAEKIGLLIDDPKLRKTLVANAQESLGYTWAQQTEMIWKDILQTSSLASATLIPATTREQRILHSISIATGEGLELGPLTSPIVTKEQGNIYYVDHMSQEDLKNKYMPEPVDLDKIVPVDFALNNKSLTEVFGDKKFDYVIASHVIEHIPDTISWLKDVANVLKPGGILSLVVPDKRFTFDINRRETLPFEVLGAYLDRLVRPSSAMMYDFASNYTPGVDTAQAWFNPDKYTNRKSQRRWSPQEVYGMCQQNLDPSQYVDSHCLVFTPHSFIEILRELINQGLLDYEISYFLETQECELEFYVSLVKIKHTNNSKKSQLASLPKISKISAEKELKKRIATLQQEIAALKHSFSWRITDPLRAIRGTLGRFL